ncbi:hypothetical protein KKE03_02810 [Patescibacteria group bacterium]|nr:hypothetical protein [Patescibacteria group bacterium]
MNRNVSIVVVILVLVVIAGYLVWLRSKVSPAISPQAEEQVIPTVQPTEVASPSAITVEEEATDSVQQKTATPGAAEK